MTDTVAPGCRAGRRRPGGRPGGHPVRRRSAPDHRRAGRAGRRSVPLSAVGRARGPLAEALEGRGLRLQQLDGSWQLSTSPAVADRVRRYAERGRGTPQPGGGRGPRRGRLPAAGDARRRGAGPGRGLRLGHAIAPPSAAHHRGRAPGQPGATDPVPDDLHLPRALRPGEPRRPPPLVLADDADVVNEPAEPSEIVEEPALAADQHGG